MAQPFRHARDGRQAMLRSEPNPPLQRSQIMRAIDVLAAILVIVGALNWGLVGAFNVNLVTALFGQQTIVSSVVFILVGLAGLYIAARWSMTHKQLGVVPA